MKNSTYDILKKIALVVLPALATMIITIFNIWNIPYGEEIGATITAIDTALGIILGISTYQYNKEVTHAEDLTGVVNRGVFSSIFHGIKDLRNTSLLRQLRILQF